MERMEILMEDFANAYREITPTAMREVYIEVPTVHWEDIGGLDEVKEDLKSIIPYWKGKTLTHRLMEELPAYIVEQLKAENKKEYL